MSILWSPTAVADLLHIRAYIAERDPSGAHSVVDRMFEAVERLDEFPASGRPGRLPHTRELVVGGTPYVIPYRVAGRDVQILAVLYGARRWPERPP